MKHTIGRESQVLLSSDLSWCDQVGSWHDAENLLMDEILPWLSFPLH